MDLGGLTAWGTSGWEEVMAKLLDHAMPMVPDQYDADVFVRIMRDLEMALTKTEIPAVISGQDDTNGISWFME